MCSCFFYFGGNLIFSSQFDSEYAEKFKANYGASIAYKKPISNNFDFYTQLNFFLANRKANLLNMDGSAFAAIINSKGFDLLIGADYYFPVFTFLKAGATIAAGPNISTIEMTGFNAVSEYYAIGYKITGKIGVELNLFIPIRLAGLYEFGKTESLLFRSFGLELLVNIFNF